MRQLTTQIFSIAFLLSLVKLEFLRSVLKKYYAEKWRWKKFECIAMLKLTVFRMIKRKDRCAVIRYLGIHGEEAKLLGFSELPSPKTIWHWEKIRIGCKGFREIFNEVVWEVKTLLAPIGIVLGKIICQDSTPVQATRNDEDEMAEYNPHYKLYMYKGDLQWCALTGIPTNYGLNNGLGFDGTKLVPMFDDSKKFLHLDIGTIIGDCHYNTFENHFELTHNRGVKLVCRFPKDHKLDRQGTIKALMEKYRQYWQNKNYVVPPVDFQHVLRLLAGEDAEIVGRYYKNLRYQELLENEAAYMSLYHKRNNAEGGNGIFKERTNFARLKENGRKTAELHIAMHMIALLITSPLFLLQRGAKTNLMRAQHYEA